MISRRSMLGPLASLLVAPAIVRASSLMPISVATLEQFDDPWLSIDLALNETNLERALVDIRRLMDDTTKVVRLGPHSVMLRPEYIGAFDGVHLISTSHPVRS